MSSDPVADMLARIRNAAQVQKEEVAMPHSRLKEEIARILDREGYLEGFRVEGEEPKRNLVLGLKYGQERERAISGLRRVSTPGRRVYADRGHLPRVLGGLGVAILSTSQGLMTDRQAARAGVGGEVLCEIW
jgi:small subunit ribosomal protein S8